MVICLVRGRAHRSFHPTTLSDSVLLPVDRSKTYRRRSNGHGAVDDVSLYCTTYNCFVETEITRVLLVVLQLFTSRLKPTYLYVVSLYTEPIGRNETNPTQVCLTQAQTTLVRKFGCFHGRWTTMPVLGMYMGRVCFISSKRLTIPWIFVGMPEYMQLRWRHLLLDKKLNSRLDSGVPMLTFTKIHGIWYIGMYYDNTTI